jgi:tRNA threonylcarbamoyl adenosine modification protein (Sua5/YciO/YrdC/YwlC family)
MLLKIYPENPNPRLMDMVIDCLQKGGLVVFPTDTVYGLGCDIYNHKAAEKLAALKGTRLEKAEFSFIFSDLRHLSDFTKQLDKEVFKLLKKNLPGPFTFILPANRNVPKIFKGKKKTIGIRVPDNPIVIEMVKMLGNPLLTTSVHDEDEVIEYTSDPELIHEKYGTNVDIVIDGGYGSNIASTVVDCTGDEPIIIREGAGILIF